MVVNASHLARVLEFGEAAGWTDLYLAAPPSVGLKTVHIGGAVVLVSLADTAFIFNRVIGLGIEEPATEAMLDEIAAVYADAGIARYEVCIAPAAEPANDLPLWLETRGLRLNGNTAKCVRPARDTVEAPTDLHVEEVTARHAREVTAIQAAVFGMAEAMRPAFEASVGRPNWHFYLAFDGEKPVATGTLHIENGVGWLGSGATLPSHRRRGAQGAIMAHRINEAIAQRCNWIVVETDEETPEQPNPSYHNMRRTGFELAYLRAHCQTPWRGQAGNSSCGTATGGLSVRPRYCDVRRVPGLLRLGVAGAPADALAMTT